MIDKSVNYTKNSLAGLEKELTPRLQQDAMDSGWPNYLAESLQVVVNGSNITVSYPELYAQEIEDLEYGNQQLSPNPVLRTFISRNDYLIIDHLGSWSLDRLEESEMFQ